MIPMTRAPFRLALPDLLRLDAVTCLAMGLLMAFGSQMIANLTDLPAPLLLWAGVALLPIGLFMFAVAAIPAFIRAGTWIVIAGNLAWAAASLILLLSGLVAPNAPGTAFVTIQALAVLGLAVLEMRAVAGHAVG